MEKEFTDMELRIVGLVLGTSATLTDQGLLVDRVMNKLSEAQKSRNAGPQKVDGLRDVQQGCC